MEFKPKLKESTADFVLFETERLFVREYNIDDTAAVFAFAGDGENNAYSIWMPDTLEEVDDYIRSRLAIQSSAKKRTMYDFAVCLKESGELIGSVVLFFLNEGDMKQADLGYIFNKRFWGNGYASEVASGMLRFGFMNLGLHRITAKCDSENLASEAVMKRIGMRKEGETKQSVYTKVRGVAQWRSEKHYAMLRKAFLNAQDEPWNRMSSGFEIELKESAIDFVLFETERLFVREYNIDDFDTVKAYAGDTEVTAYLPWGPADDDTVQRIVDSRLKNQIEEPRTRFEFIVCLKDSGKAVGAVGLRLSDDLKQGDLGFIFSKRFWGRGYASEAANGMLRFGFMNLNLHRITAKCDSENLASEAVMKRIGMRKESETKQSVYMKVRGLCRWRSEKHYGMLQKEFLNALIDKGKF